MRHLALVTQRNATQRIPHHFVMGVSFVFFKGHRWTADRLVNHGEASAIIVIGRLYGRAESRETR